MKTLFAVAGLLAALKSSIVSPDNLLVILQGASEPAGVAAWGLVLLVVAAGLKRRPRRSTRALQVRSADSVGLSRLLPRIEPSERGL